VLTMPSLAHAPGSARVRGLWQATGAQPSPHRTNANQPAFVEHTRICFEEIDFRLEKKLAKRGRAGPFRERRGKRNVGDR